MSITDAVRERNYTYEDVAKLFNVSVAEAKQVHFDVGRLIENTNISFEDFQERLKEIDSFYSPVVS